MAEQTPIYCDGGCYTAQDMRQLNSALVCGEGVSTVGQGDLLVTAPGGSMSVNVAAGHAFIQGDTAGEGMYAVFNDAAVNRVLTNGGVQDRIDIVVAQLNGNCTWSIAIVEGVEGSPPSAPAVPADALLLATVAVPASDTTIEAGQITDNRTDYVACSEPEAPEMVVFAVDDTFEKADYPAARGFRVRVVGGGGQGAGAAATGAGQASVGNGGGSGSYAESVLLPSALAASEIVTVGLGGSGGGIGNPGGNGGASSFGTLVTAPGGPGGTVVMAAGSTVDVTGASAVAAAGTGQIAAGGRAGDGALRLDGTQAQSGAGGSSVLGSGGRPLADISTSGATGELGSGGSGAISRNDATKAGGLGGAGRVIVEIL